MATIFFKEKSIFAGQQQISNFIICKVSDTEFQIDNGQKIVQIKIENRSLSNFENIVTVQGNFWFIGNKSQLNRIFDLIEEVYLNKKNRFQDIKNIYDRSSNITTSKN